MEPPMYANERKYFNARGASDAKNKNPGAPGENRP